VLHQRSPLLHYLLVGLSGGPYAFYWLYLMMRDAEQVNRKRRIYPGGFLITVMSAGAVTLGSVLYAAALAVLGASVSAAHIQFMVLSAIGLQLILIGGVAMTHATLDPNPRLAARLKGMGTAGLLTFACLLSLPWLQRKLNRFVRIRATMIYR
jgi:hypothetical protein